LPQKVISKKESQKSKDDRKKIVPGHNSTISAQKFEKDINLNQALKNESS